MHLLQQEICLFVKKKKFKKKRIKRIKRKKKMKRNERSSEQSKKILPKNKTHKCEKTKVNLFKCKNRCRIFCKDHLPENKKCDECNENLIIHKDFEKNHKIKCLHCLEDFVFEKGEMIQKENLPQKKNFSTGIFPTTGNKKK